MARTYEEYLAEHPLSEEERAEVDTQKKLMLAEVRAQADSGTKDSTLPELW